MTDPRSARCSVVDGSVAPAAARSVHTPTGPRTVRFAEVEVIGPGVGDLAEDLAERTRTAVALQTLDDALMLVIELAVQTGVCDYAGVTQRMADGTFQTAAPSHPVVLQADALQYELQQGPCVLASVDGDVQSSPDVAADPRWPRWGPRARALGVLSAVSVQLYTDRNTAMGALNLYAAVTRRYTGVDLDVARLIGAHASVALAHFRGEAHLWTAVDARHRIGMAQGILMNKLGLTAEQAFNYLQRRSQWENVKLHLIADAIVNQPTEAVLQMTMTTPAQQAKGADGERSSSLPVSSMHSSFRS